MNVLRAAQLNTMIRRCIVSIRNARAKDTRPIESRYHRRENSFPVVSEAVVVKLAQTAAFAAEIAVSASAPSIVKAKQ